MTININAAAGKAALDAPLPQQMADMMKSMGFGHFVRSMPIRLIGLVPGAAASNPYVAAAALPVTLPDDAKAALIHRAYARAGTGTLAALTIDTPDPTGAAAAPAAGHCAISPSGDLVFNGTDAFTSVDVLYLPEKYEVMEFILPVASNALTLPTGFGGVLLLLEAEGLLPTDAKLIVDAPATSVAAGHAALNAAKTSVAFNSAAAFTSARVKVAVQASIDLNAFLTQTQVYF